MLVLSRKVGEIIRVSHDVKIVVVEIRGDRVRIGVEAPRDVSIHREEVWLQINRQGDVKEPGA